MAKRETELESRVIPYEFKFRIIFNKSLAYLLFIFHLPPSEQKQQTY